MAATNVRPRLNHRLIPAPANSTKYAPASFKPASEAGSAGANQIASSASARIATGAISGRNSAAIRTGAGLAFLPRPGRGLELDAVLGRVVVQDRRGAGGFFPHPRGPPGHGGGPVCAVVGLVADAPRPQAARGGGPAPAAGPRAPRPAPGPGGPSPRGGV